MSVYYEHTYPVDSRDVDIFGHCRPSAVLGILQEAAASASVALEISRDEVIAKYHVFWMLVRVWYRLERPLLWDERVLVRTWHRGGRGAAMYRDFDLFVDGKQVGEAVTTWVLADVDTHKLAPLSLVKEFEGSDGGALCKTVKFHRVRMPETLAPGEERPMRYSDADVNGHVNNIKYADFLCDALGLAETGRGRFVSGLQLGYLAECRPGEALKLHTAWAEDTGYVRGSGPEGGARFDGALTLKDLDNPGLPS